MVYEYTCFNAHGTCEAAQAVACTSFDAGIYKLFFQQGYPGVGRIDVAQTLYLADGDNTLACGESKAAAYAVRLAEAAFDAVVDCRVNRGKHFCVLDIASGVFVEYDSRIEQSVRVEKFFHFVHNLPGRFAPFYFYKWSHVASGAMFGFERAVEALYHKMLDVEHQLRVAFTIGIGVELLRYDEVVVPFEGVAVDAGVVVSAAIEYFQQLCCSLRQVFDVECNILDKCSGACRTSTSDSREYPRPQMPPFGALLRVGREGHRLEGGESVKHLHGAVDFIVQLFG